MVEGKQPPLSAVVDAGVRMHQIRRCRSSHPLHHGPMWHRRDPVKARQIQVYFCSVAVWAREGGEWCPAV
uniref:Uncharacterized protein n=1 Tax=Arundo donax TaxID=35708 RepID=A0A0A9DRW7_ARUDO